MEKNTQSLFSLSSILILALLFIALVMISSALFRGARVDLTENQLYTLNQGSKNILRNLEEPVTLTLYFSQDSSRDLPQIRSYAQRVRDLLTEFSEQSEGKLSVKEIDPKPFSEEEDQAAAVGIQALPVNNAGDSLYFGIAGSNSLDDLQLMPFLQPEKEEFLEYDLAKIVKNLGHPQQPVVGLISGLEIAPGFDPATQQAREAWVIYEQLDQLFDLQLIDVSSQELPQDLQVLLLIHPKQLSHQLRYAIDQFVLGGGRLVAFLDPLAEADRPPANPNDPFAQMNADSASDLPDLLAAWGIGFNSAQVVGDMQYALQVGLGPNQPPVRHLGILGIPRQSMSQQDVVSADLESVNLSTAGYFSTLPATDGADGDAVPGGLAMEALLSSSDSANTLEAAQLKFLPDPSTLLDGFVASETSYPLVVRLTGGTGSAFNDNLPEGMDPEQHLQSSQGPVSIILFGDTDLLSDRFWVQKQAFFGQNLISAFADNGNLVVNAVDNMLGNADLIGIRARPTATRPFTRVQALRLEAEQRYRATEQSLQQELAEAEANLNELQNTRQDDNLTVLSPEQQEEVQRFVDRRLQIRKDLRQVQRDLDRDIESLGSRLKVINIVLMPLLVIAIALLFNFRRNRRQSLEQAT